MKALAKEYTLLLHTCKVILIGNRHKAEVSVVAKGVLVYVHTPTQCDTTRYLVILVMRFAVVFMGIQNLVHEKIKRRPDLGRACYHIY
jgi:hypothetical protein